MMQTNVKPKMKIMKKKNLVNLFFAMTAFSLLLFSCEKSDEIPEGELLKLEGIAETNTSMDNLLQEAMEEIDEYTMLENLMFQNHGLKSAVSETGSSGTRNVNTTINSDSTVSIVIDYENFVNPRSRHQRVKNGRILVTVKGRPLGPYAFIRTIVFESFSIGPHQIEGTKVVEKDLEVPYRYTVTLTNGKVIFPDGGILIREFERVITWREGYDTPFFIWDDVYTIEGQGRGVSRQGEKFNQQIIEPLVVRRDCRWIVSGIIEMSLGERKIRIDYGNGECSNEYRVRSGNRSRTFRQGED